MLVFLVTPCLMVAVQPCMEWIAIKKKNDTLIKLLYYPLEAQSQACLKISIAEQRVPNVLIFWRSPLPFYCLSSLFFFKFCPSPTPKHPLFLIPCFFGWMFDYTTSNMSFCKFSTCRGDFPLIWLLNFS